MNRDLVYLCHIRDAIDKIERYVAVGEEVFLTTTHWQDAVIRNLEIIGEATKRISDEPVKGKKTFCIILNYNRIRTVRRRWRGFLRHRQ